MKILNSDEIFDLYVTEHYEKFSLALYANVPMLKSISNHIKMDIFKKYYEHGCEFNFYFWLDTLKLLQLDNNIIVSKEVSEHILTVFEESNYGIIISNYDFYHCLYLSFKEYGELYEFESIDTCKKFAEENKEIFRIYTF